MRNFPEPDKPDDAHWKKYVVPKMNATKAEIRAHDLAYAAKCEKLELKPIIGKYFTYWEVLSIKKVISLKLDEVTLKTQSVSMHRAIKKETAEAFIAEAEKLRRLNQAAIF